MSATAVAHSNIALVKYWGKRLDTDPLLNLPAVGSISVTLDGLKTTTTVAFEGTGPDRVQIGESRDVLHDADKATERRVSTFLDLIRNRAGIRTGAVVRTHNNFPTGAGLASSASAFAALAMAASQAAGLRLSAKQLSILARCGSGSAARSIFGGFVELHRGVRSDGEDCFAEPMASATHWPLAVVVAVTNEKPKSVGSTRGMGETAASSPYYGAWVDSHAADMSEARQAIQNKDFERLARVTEYSCLKMHASMFSLSPQPGLVYWEWQATVDVMQCGAGLSQSGRRGMFTIDADRTAAICLLQVQAHSHRFADIPGVQRVIRTALAQTLRFRRARHENRLRNGSGKAGPTRGLRRCFTARRHWLSQRTEPHVSLSVRQMMVVV
ncbi:MAG: diphosphomevalonate decarboxylase [Myxococcota bacterium]